jgi:hypothetical protein
MTQLMGVGTKSLLIGVHELAVASDHGLSGLVQAVCGGGCSA